MIFVSTGGMSDQTAAVTASNFIDHGIRKIELSSGLPDPAQLGDLKSLSGNAQFQIHNYFPPPPDPFVFNLASPDGSIADRSMAHVRNALQWAIALECDVYSFHAGYLLDPDIHELGGRMKRHKLCHRERALEKFGRRVVRLAEEAKRYKMELLIENNVVSESMMNVIGDDPCLLSTPEECDKFMSLMPSNVGLLIDVGHAKVSGHSLGFNPAVMIEKCLDFTRGYHLSDNDGHEDSNQIVGRTSWFWPYLKKDAAFYTLEIYDVNPGVFTEQIELIHEMLKGA